MEIAFILGRILFGVYFAYSGFNHFKNMKMLTGYSQMKGVTLPSLLFRLPVFCFCWEDWVSFSIIMHNMEVYCWPFSYFQLRLWFIIFGRSKMHSKKWASKLTSQKTWHCSVLCWCFWNFSAKLFNKRIWPRFVKPFMKQRVQIFLWDQRHYFLKIVSGNVGMFELIVVFFYTSEKWFVTDIFS